MFRRIKECRACQGANLVKVLDLGVQPLANDFQQNGSCKGYAPLGVLFCRDCTLAQLSVVVEPELLYGDYPYVTSKSETMFAHFRDLERDIKAEVDYTVSANNPESTDFKILEIGSNDGTFLSQWPCHERYCLGFEPAKNLAKIANERGIKTIPRMFDESTAMELAGTGYRADVIVARHVFAHIDYWRGFISALEMVSHENTLIVIEVPYVGDMLKVNSFDQIYHEHLSYVSITAIRKLLVGTPFFLHDVKHYDIHGGCIGLFIRKCPTAGIRFWNAENNEECLEDDWRRLARKMSTMIEDLKIEVRRAKIQGKTVCGFGASAKATVWCNACGFTADDIKFICDSTEQKVGRFVPGTNIPVMPENALAGAEVCINFAWNYPEIYERFKGWNGRWIVPVPEVRLM